MGGGAWLPRRALVPLRPLEGERVVSIPSDSGLVLRGDLLLPARTPAPLVVLLHKAAGDRAIYRDLASRLVAAGIGSLRMDLRGHGESLGRGRFVPGQPAAVIAGTDRDIAAVWRFVRGLPGVDTSRLATVSGSYSSRSAMVAARTIGYGRAHAALSPGDFTDEAFRAAAASGASWLFVRSDSERFVGDWLDAKVRAFVPGAELWVVPAGSAHATDLLAADPAFPGRLTAWLARQLSAPGGSGPGPRNAHGAAYDIRDRSLVLFGGATEREVGGDTWRWNGSWRRIAESGPEPRTFPAMAFDSARGEVVLFGGNRVLFGDGTTPPRMLGDTWVLRGDRWVRVSTGGPSPRAEAAVAYDAGRGRTVLFGGRDLRPGGGTHRLGDTWEWDGRRWYRVSTSGPSARSGAAMAYDPGLRAVVLFGGSGGPLGDSWIWDGLRWRKLPVPDAPGRFNTVMAWDPGARTLVRFGGWDGGGRAADTWVREPAGWVVVDSAGPAARNHAVLVSAPDRGALLLYGGHDGDRVFGDLWEWRGGGWVAIDSAAPVARVANGH
jgi:dienelactone hydrolase